MSSQGRELRKDEGGCHDAPGAGMQPDLLGDGPDAVPGRGGHRAAHRPAREGVYQVGNLEVKHEISNI